MTDNKPHQQISGTGRRIFNDGLKTRNLNTEAINKANEIARTQQETKAQEKKS